MSIFAIMFLIALSPAQPSLNVCTLAEELNLLIAKATSYATPPCPQIGFAVLPIAGALRSQAGAFFPATRQIELAPDLDLATPYGQSYLLHELVHAAQYANGAQHTANCPAALEAEAYAVQADFLRAHQMGREAVMMNLFAGQLGSCSP